MTGTTLKHNTRIEVRVGGFGTPFSWTPARIFNRAPKSWGSLDDMPGWHRVKYEDGGILCMHERGFRVVEAA